MLDFYIISNSEGTPKDIEKLVFAGGLEFDVFNRLVRKGIINSRFEYYDDFRLSNQLLNQIHEIIILHKTDSDIDSLKQIIDQALAVNSGLIAYGD